MSVRLPSRLLALFASVAATLAVFAVPAVADEGEVRLLVTYAEPVDAASADDGLPVAGTFSTASAPAAGAVGEDSAVQVLSFDGHADAEAARGLLAGREGVVSVEEDSLLYPAAVDPATTTTSTAVPSWDAGAGSWGVRNFGQRIEGRDGRARIDIGATEAWPYATGRDVVVAVIDTGVDVGHPLLRDQLWRNPRAGTTRVGPWGTVVGDVHGWNFAQGNAQLFRDPVADAHGTHVAGIIAGAPDETSDFSGVAPDAKLMVLKFMDGASGTVSAAIAALHYAVAHGADVINASWTSPTPSLALQVALAETGLPVVAAAGNSGPSTLEAHPLYPVAWRLDNVVGVAAIDHLGQLASYSTRSRDLVDVVAPGSNILSTVPGQRLARMSGTSQAAPHVTGAIALALQHHPELSAGEVIAAVRASVRPLAGMRETRSGGLVRAPLLLDRLGTPVPACPHATAAAFTDVRLGTAHAPAVSCLVSLGITQGRNDGTYGATSDLTRGQVASMVARVLDRTGRLPAAPEVGRFVDFAGDHVHRDAIEALASVGIVLGRSDDVYDPDTTTTRAEFAAIVTRTNDFVSGGPWRVYGPRFADTVGHVDEGRLRAALGLRIVAGLTDGSFAPDTAVRRDQAATMLGRLLDRLVQEGLLDPAVA